MVIYTPLPAEIVLAEDEEERCFVEVRSGSAILLVEPVSFNKGRIVSMSSTDPQDYIAPGLQPGDIIRLGSLVVDREV